MRQGKPKPNPNDETTNGVKRKTWKELAQEVAALNAAQHSGHFDDGDDHEDDSEEEEFD